MKYRAVVVDTSRPLESRAQQTFSNNLKECEEWAEKVLPGAQAEAASRKAKASVVIYEMTETMVKEIV